MRALARGCRSLTRPTPKAIAETFSAQEWRCFAEPVTFKAALSFASHPAGLPLPRARFCAAQPSPPFFFVFSLFFLGACACCPLSLGPVSTVIRLECHWLPPCAAG